MPSPHYSGSDILPPAHTYEALLTTLSYLPALLPKRNCDLDILLPHIHQASVRMQWLRDNIKIARYNDENTMQAVQILDAVTDIEDIGVQGWVNWAEELTLKGKDKEICERSRECCKRSSANDNDENSYSEMIKEMTAQLEKNDENDNLDQRIMVSLKLMRELGERLGEAMEEDCTECVSCTNSALQQAHNEDERARTTKKRIRVLQENFRNGWMEQARKDGRKIEEAEDSDRRCQFSSPSTAVKSGSSMSGRSSQKGVHWTRSRIPHNMGDAYLPPLIPSTTITLENDANAHFRAKTDWIDEEEDRRFNLSSSSFPPGFSPPVHALQHGCVGPYMHIPLSGGFTLPCYDEEFCPITFNEPSSVFYFPLGCTLQQLHSLIHQLRASGLARSEFGHQDDGGVEINFIPVRTPSMKRSLKKAIARVMLKEDKKYAEYCIEYITDGLSKMEEAGDSWIVSTPNIHITGVDFVKPDSDESRRGKTATVEDDPEDDHLLTLRGGDDRTAYESPTTGLMNAHKFASKISNASHQFRWMQEAHTLQLKLSDLQWKFEELQRQHQETQRTIEIGNRRMSGEKKNEQYGELEQERTRRQLVDQRETSRMRGGGYEQLADSQISDLDLSQAVMDWKHWKGFPEPGHEADSPHLDDAAISTSQPKISDYREHSTCTISATAFLFFPSVSIITLLTEPKQFFQWEHPRSLSQIREFLQDRKARNTEDNPTLARVREILEIRDDVGIPDPDVSNGKMVLISLPESIEPIVKPADKERPTWDRSDNSFEARRNSKGEDAKEYMVCLEAINSLRRKRRLPDIDMSFNYSSSSDVEARYKAVGHLINVLNENIDYLDEYEATEGSSCSCSECDEALDRDCIEVASKLPALYYQSHIRGNAERRSIVRNSLSLDPSFNTHSPNGNPASESRQLTPPPDSLPPMFAPLRTHYEPEPDSFDAIPSHNEHLHEWRHPKNLGCESWTGRLDPMRDSCTYCHLPFVELEPQPINSTSNSSNISNNDNVETMSNRFQRHFSTQPRDNFTVYGEPHDDYMKESYPFKICTNPYAFPGSTAPDTTPAASSLPCHPRSCVIVPSARKAHGYDRELEQARDFYRRAAEDEPSVGEDIGILEATFRNSNYRIQNQEQENEALRSAIEATRLRFYEGRGMIPSEDVVVEIKQKNDKLEDHFRCRETEHMAQEIENKFEDRRTHHMLESDIDVVPSSSPVLAKYHAPHENDEYTEESRLRGGEQRDHGIVDYVEYIVPPPSSSSLPSIAAWPPIVSSELYPQKSITSTYHQHSPLTFLAANRSQNSLNLPILKAKEQVMRAKELLRKAKPAPQTENTKANVKGKGKGKAKATAMWVNSPTEAGPSQSPTNKTSRKQQYGEYDSDGSNAPFYGEAGRMGGTRKGNGI